MPGRTDLLLSAGEPERASDCGFLHGIHSLIAHYSQPAAEKRGFDAGKKVVGLIRNIAVDTDGRLLMVNLTTADISDSAGAQAIVVAVRKRWPWLKHLFADRGLKRPLIHPVTEAEEAMVVAFRRHTLLRLSTIASMPGNRRSRI
ncbi:hypothetical protein HNP60_002637 [Sphingobium sp. B1D3A]|uniref:Transposase IS4-like domain-containing protein n=1 Tax=Sphingobium lignivorans TaxID=2735886 RepID=A0ABR6NJK9_9SPHN|nr:hypothetical protein [Sphingobium lignivorans]